MTLEYWETAMAEYPLLFTFFAIWIGCSIGSFLNVCIWRIPNGMSIVSPPSHCPKCGHSIPFYLNVPIFSWLILRGKCANCALPISPRYIIVEAMTGLVFGAIFFSNVAAEGAVWLLLPYFAGASVVIACAFTDCDYRIIPDKLTFFLILFALGCSAVFRPWGAFAFQCAFAGGVFVFLYLFSRAARLVFKREAFGLGDVKMLTATACVLDGFSFPVMLLGACLLALLLTPLYRHFKPKMRHRGIPFAPFIAPAFIAAVIFSTQIARFFMPHA